MNIWTKLFCACLLFPVFAHAETQLSKIICAGDFPGWAPGRPAQLHTDFYLENDAVTKSRIKLGAGYLILPVSVLGQGDHLLVSMGYLNGKFTYHLPLRLISGVTAIAEVFVEGQIDGRFFTSQSSCHRN